MDHLHPRGARSRRATCSAVPAVLLLAVLFVAAAGLAAVPVLAQEAVPTPEPDPGQQAMMEAWTKAMTPGEPHARLAAYAGEYTMTIKSWVDPKGEPEVSEGTSRYEMILDGRFLQETVESSVMGQPFHGRGLTGYDNVRGHYWSTWVDSMSTGTIVATGHYDEETGGMVMRSEYADPLTGETKEIRTFTRHLDDGRIVFEWFEPVDGGGEAKTMEIVYQPAG